MGSNSALPLTSRVTSDGESTCCLTSSVSLFPHGKQETSPPPGRWRELNQLRCGMGPELGTQWALIRCSRFLLPLLLLLLPGSIQEELGIPPVFPVPLLGAPWAVALHRELPKLAPAHSAIQGGWHSIRREQEAGPWQRQQMGTSWAVAGAGWQLPGAGRPGSPSPAHPWHGAPPASGFSSRQRGQGGLAGLQGWAGGFPLWACFLQAPSQMQGRLQSGGLTAPGLPITLITSLSSNACTLITSLSSKASPRAFARAAPLPGALSCNPSSLPLLRLHLKGDPL